MHFNFSSAIWREKRKIERERERDSQDQNSSGSKQISQNPFILSEIFVAFFEEKLASKNFSAANAKKYPAASKAALVLMTCYLFFLLLKLNKKEFCVAKRFFCKKNQISDG